MGDPSVVVADDGPGWSQLPVALSPQLLIILAVLAAIIVFVAGGVGWWGWRRARRSPHARAGVLRAQAARPGTPGQIAALRLRLTRATTHTDRVLTALGTGSVAGGLVDLAGQVRQQAAACDDRLALLYHEPDAATVRAALPAMCEHVEQIETACGQLRHAAMALADTDADHRADVTRQVDDTVAGLLAGVAEMRRLDHRRP